MYITDFSISGLDPAKHAYELEKFLRIAFSHESVAGITLGDLWDKTAKRPGSGLYATTKQPKPAASKLEQLWTSEWTTRVNADLTAKGMLDFEVRCMHECMREICTHACVRACAHGHIRAAHTRVRIDARLLQGFYGTYQYEVRSATRTCAGVVELPAPKRDPTQGYWAGAPPQEITLSCPWQVRACVHEPTSSLPRALASAFVPPSPGTRRRALYFTPCASASPSCTRDEHARALLRVGRATSICPWA